jgi:hypothetical protein
MRKAKEKIVGQVLPEEERALLTAGGAEEECLAGKRASKSNSFARDDSRRSSFRFVRAGT